MTMKTIATFRTFLLAFMIVAAISCKNSHDTDNGNQEYGSGNTEADVPSTPAGSKTENEPVPDTTNTGEVQPNSSGGTGGR
jgi:hypothetical protein